MAAIIAAARPPWAEAGVPGRVIDAEPVAPTASHPPDVAAEIVRRAAEANGQTGGYVVRLSDPPTPSERLQLLAARLERRPIVIMPHKYRTIDEWLERYGSVGLDSQREVAVT